MAAPSHRSRSETAVKVPHSDFIELRADLLTELSGFTSSFVPPESLRPADYKLLSTVSLLYSPVP